MKTIFVDTNFFIQCKGVEALSWDALFGKDEAINILVPRAVQKEIDNFKGQGNSRRARKSKDANKLFKQILESDGGFNLTDKVRVFFTARKELAKATPEPTLDPNRNDDSIILEVLAHRDIFPENDALLLTNDTGLMVTAKEYEIPYKLIPKDWLLDNEPDDKDKLINSLRSELLNLKKNYPDVKVEVCSDKKNIKVKEFRPLNDSEINLFLDRHVSKSAYNKDYLYRVNSPLLSFLSPTESQITRYNDTELPDWKKKSAKCLKEFHFKLHRKLNTHQIIFSISNLGNFPAENLLVEFKASEDLILFAPFDANKKAITLPTIPSSPTSDLFGTLTASKVSRNLLPSPNLVIPKARDNFSWDYFYSKTEPFTYASAECEEFRHKSSSKEFVFLITSEYGSHPTGGSINCKVSARNLQEPVTLSTSFKFEYIAGDAYTEIENEVEIPRE